jgi:osmoprotectant transport system permease protein
MSDELALLPGYLAAHLELTLVALGLGTLVSVPAGILITRRRALEAPLLGLASVIQTIPSLALLAIMVPALALASAWLEPALGLSLPAIGALPALVALTLYATLPILRNTVVGIAGVDPAVIEAARGVGMSGREQLLRVELPLALPVVVAGVRTATVWVVGAATLSTPVGATSLGNYIFSGLQTRNFSAVWLGCVASAALALLLDGVVRVLEAGLRERRRGLVGAAAVGLAVLGAGAGLGGLVARGAAAGAVTVGSKTFTEQYVLSEIVAGVVEARTPRRARAVQSLGSTVLFDALAQGEIDAYVDYSGTLWATLLGRRGLPDDRDEVRREVERWLAAEHGIRVAAALGFENAYALAVRGGQARELGLGAIGDLAPLAPSLEIGGDYEFFVRPEWKAVREAYGLRFRAQRSMDSSLMYEALARGEVDVISAFSTDGRIAALDLRVLADDRRAIPPYDALVLVGARIAREAPDVLAALGRLDGAIDADAMRRMNAAVDRDGRAPGAVAREFLAGLD